MKDYILGIHYGHDATLCLMEDGKIIEVMSEERLSRQKKHHGFPHESLKYIKNKYKIEWFKEVVVAGAVKGYNTLLFTNLEENKNWRENPPQENRFLRAIAFKTSSFSPIVSARRSLSKLKKIGFLSKSRGAEDVENRSHKFLENTFPGSRITYIHHHLAHAYSTIPFMEDYKRKIVLTLDGQGDDLAGSINVFDGKKVEIMHRVEIGNSLGLFYCAFVDILGMRKNEHEFKVMGLAPYAKKSSGESEYSTEEIREAIKSYPFMKECEVTYFDRTKGEVIEHKVASLLAGNDVVGRFSGRAEWGARALGNRSILANPSSRDNVKLINEMIKGRDFWMPFATSLLYERRHDYLDLQKEFYAPFMAITFNTKPLAHKELPAALHPYDLTSRPQMVKKEVNPRYHQLISHFEALTGIGGILNTSFNLHGEPNVETPYDAIRTFHLSGLKYLALGDFLIAKK